MERRGLRLGVQATRPDTERGPEIARDARLATTLDAFIRATDEALRVGHAPATLQDIIERQQRERKSA